MKNVVKILVFVQLVFFSIGVTLAQKSSGVNISGLAYNAYYYDFSKGSKNKNGFDISRLYFTLKKSLSENINVRFTTDIGRVSNYQERAYYRLYLKYGYVEFNKPSWNIKLLVGLHYVPLLAYQEAVIWKYRSISKMLLDLEHKQTSSDLGVKLHGQFPGNHGEYVFSFVNGEGYAQPEIGKHKGYYWRVTLKPFTSSLPGFQITGAVSYIQSTTISSIATYTAFATYQSPKGTLAAELSMGNDKINRLKTNFVGTSFFGFYKLTSKWTLIGRIDWFDPDKGKEIDTHFREIIGIGYWINKDVELILDYQGVHYKEGAMKTDSNILYTHLHFVF